MFSLLGGDPSQKEYPHKPDDPTPNAERMHHATHLEDRQATTTVKDATLENATSASPYPLSHHLVAVDIPQLQFLLPLLRISGLLLPQLPQDLRVVGEDPAAPVLANLDAVEGADPLPLGLEALCLGLSGGHGGL